MGNKGAMSHVNTGKSHRKTDDSEKSSQSKINSNESRIHLLKTENKPHVFPLKECENYATTTKRNINYHEI